MCARQSSARRDPCPRRRGRAASLAAALLSVLLVGLAGCQRTDELSLLASARRHVDAEEHLHATLQLKTLLQQRPDSPDARFLLGKALLAGGDPVGAEAELRRARSLGYAEAEVVPLLASALLARRQPDKVVAEFGTTTLQDAAAAAELRTQVALAEAELGKLEVAEATVAQVLQRRPDHTPARLLEARLAAARGRGDDARRLAAALLAKEPDNAQAWVLQGDLLQLAGGDPDAAVQAYRKALALRKKLLPAYTGALTLLIARSELTPARQLFEQMAAALPDSTATAYFDAVLRYLGGDARGARDKSQLLLAVSPDTPQLLLLTALCELRLGGETQAQTMLEKAVSIVPDEPEPRLVLARLHLRAGKPQAALDILRPLLGPRSADIAALTLAAQAHLLAGDHRQSEVLLARAAAVQPGDPAVRTAVARSLLARGQFEPGLRELQAAAAADAEGGDADLLLVTARLRRNELPAAMAAASELARKQPRQALPEHLRGHVALLQRDPRTARQAFEAALQRNPAFLPSLLRLAELDLADNRPEAARARYQALLERRPDDVDAMFALAALVRRSGGSEADAAAWLGKAARVRPKDSRTWAAAIDRLLDTGAAGAAHALAREATTALPEQPELWLRLARAQLAAAAPQPALESLARLHKLVAPTPASQLLAAQAHAALGDDAGAALQVRSALALQPDALPALRMAVEISLRRQRLQEALDQVREVQGRHPADAIGHLLEGDIHAHRRQWAEAAAAFRRAAERRNPGDAAERAHWALLQADPAAARAFEQDWRKRHPADLAFVNHLGEMAMLRNDFAAADDHLRQVLAGQPQHVNALNNRAMILLRSQPAQALALAQQAAQLAPERAEVLDTLAAAWAQSGRKELAVAWQQRAVALAPANPGLRLALARHLLAAGDKVRARAELQQLAQLGPSFSAAKEVKRLLESTGS